MSALIGGSTRSPKAACANQGLIWSNSCAPRARSRRRRNETEAGSSLPRPVPSEAGGPDGLSCAREAPLDRQNASRGAEDVELVDRTIRRPGRLGRHVHRVLLVDTTQLEAIHRLDLA